MNVFQRQRLAHLKRVVFDPGQRDESVLAADDERADARHWAEPASLFRSKTRHRRRWSFDPGTAVLLSAGIIILSILMVWAASASPPSDPHPISAHAPQARSAPPSEDSPPSPTNTPTGTSSATPTGPSATSFPDTGGHNPAQGASSPKGSKLTHTGTPHHTQRPTWPGAPQPGDEEAAATIVVHVAGAVHQPGIVTLPAGARVHQAITAAGGMRGDAAREANNLAAFVLDGQFLYVPTTDEASQGSLPAGAGGAANPGTFPTGSPSGDSTGNSARRSQGASAPGCIDINHADADTLDELPGVGPALSSRIVEYRNANGPFARIEDLDSVPGIGMRMINTLRSQVCP